MSRCACCPKCNRYTKTLASCWHCLRAARIERNNRWAKRPKWARL